MNGDYEGWFYYRDFPYGFRSQWWEAYNSLLEYIILFVKETRKWQGTCFIYILDNRIIHKVSVSSRHSFEAECLTIALQNYEYVYCKTHDTVTMKCRSLTKKVSCRCY